MIKYIVEHDDGIEIVVNTRADAEEYILSLAEEGVYEEYTGDTLYYDVSFDEFMEGCHNHMEEVNNYRKRWGCYGTYRPFQTLYGFMLNYHGEHYFVREVTYLDD